MICHVYGRYYAKIASEGIERKRDTVLRKHVVSLRWHAFMLWNIVKSNEDKPSQHYYTTDLSSIAQNAFSLGDFGGRD
jgi:hypothetical protein